MVSTGELADLRLPEGARLVHIGPSKTGTTSLQGAMWAARAELRRQGVRYAGQSRHSGFAGRAVAGQRSPYSNEGRPPPIRHWEAIVRELERAPEPRAIFSSEFLAHADDAAVRRIVRDLDPARVHVAVTLRPLPRMLASRWQQDVQAGSTRPFDAWLEGHLGREGEHPDVKMWHAHRHDRLIAHWAEVVGLDRVTAVVVDDRDHARVLRVFEALLGLREGTLELQDDYDNRSLVRDEAEAVRALNARLKADGVARRTATFLVRDGAARQMKLRTPGPDEARIVPPRWALERAGEIARSVVAGIAASGVRVVGDLESLLVVPSGPADGSAPDGRLPVDAAVAMAIGTVRGSGVLPGGGEPGADGRAADGRRRLDRRKELPMFSDGQLLRLLVRRKRTEAARWLRARRGSGAEE